MNEWKGIYVPFNALLGNNGNSYLRRDEMKDDCSISKANK